MLGGLWGIITTIVVGLILGVIGRMIAPGDQKIPMWLTIVVGIIAAFIGNWLAGVFGVRDTAGIDWIRHAFQVGAAIVGVIGAAAIYAKVKGGGHRTVT
ncbi:MULTISPECIES: GlsB/YeaQ/YmgE family stress response membrane protein [Amycolatopsis]|uniref:Membrane protein YeaQ/YmgE (Transglycosylase-associated protein family) n=1 Tax=Amycolatopsis roodepoortensis TaxID=700274 RepID=A0ABR9LKA6_9PSEU|nr:GlsB/YeaQ/YmgE family stress response membrane protein [Amycolatopsis roodepoortensis]MBE1580648.1 putative membrane protein YeaQ/YmgE (transglycosylase-associated protein family) [Amycolatopsis roodepoortensis]RSN10131.1 GlsB/YeaQ/YmgE family stress response membrane protein [Streptomyces sp. WAC 05977]UUV28029.1 GlsB/YeaQ/YmgE family stress response membrane protein [Amycolatopsis roodepoortensis]